MTENTFANEAFAVAGIEDSSFYHRYLRDLEQDRKDTLDARFLAMLLKQREAELAEVF